MIHGCSVSLRLENIKYQVGRFVFAFADGRGRIAISSGSRRHFDTAWKLDSRLGEEYVTFHLFHNISGVCQCFVNFASLHDCPESGLWKL